MKLFGGVAIAHEASIRRVLMSGRFLGLEATQLRHTVLDGHRTKHVDDSLFRSITQKLRKVADILTHESLMRNIVPSRPDLLVTGHGGIDLAEQNLVTWSCQTNAPLAALGGSKNSVLIERKQQLADKACTCIEPLCK